VHRNLNATSPTLNSRFNPKLRHKHIQNLKRKKSEKYLERERHRLKNSKASLRLPGTKCVAKRSKTLVILYKLTSDGDTGFAVAVIAPDSGSVDNGVEVFVSIVVLECSYSKKKTR
jgi:hypothetical protein